MNIVFDIETIPVQDPFHIADISASMDADLERALENVRAPANYKDAEKIDAYVSQAREGLRQGHKEAVQAAINKTSFDGGLGQIVCIGWAVNDEPAQVVGVEDLSSASEVGLLETWFRYLGKLHSTSGTRPVLIGHNSNAFDIPFVWKRAMVLGVRPPVWFPRDPKPWGESTFDTMTQWAGTKDRISMDRLCKILGIEGKGDGPTGADVWPMVQAGELKEVAAYCMDDVDRTRHIYKRMTFANVGNVTRLFGAPFAAAEH